FNPCSKISIRSKADRLQQAMRRLPPEERGTVFAKHRLKSWLKQLSRCSYGRRGFSHRSFAVSAYGNVVGDPNFRPLSRLMARRASRAADKSHGSHWLRPYDILTHPVGALATQNAAALRLKQRVEADIRNPAGT